jgi:Tol biopolymer transport system component
MDKQDAFVLRVWAYGLILAYAVPMMGQSAGGPLGIFEGQCDIGTVLHPGSAHLDAGGYVVTGSGENMWFRTDAFHYVWKKMSGDVALEAGINFPQEGKNPHRKACLVIRQSLDADSAYADIAVHGVGLTSLQYRDQAGALTHEVQSNVDAPARVRIEKRGQNVYMFVAAKSQDPLEFAGGSVRLAFKDPFYVGLGVCSHEADLSETAVFSTVKIDTQLMQSATPRLFSTLEAISIGSTDRRVIHVAPRHFEAPNWTPDGKSLIFNSDGRLFRIGVDGGAPEPIDTGPNIRCNNDHGISPDGKWLAISDQSAAPHQSMIYTLPISGGTPRRITDQAPSYWHGWSPDGKTLAFCGQRDGRFGIFTIPAAGGSEMRLTTAATGGLDDGPDYSPDGQFIYFNSDRTGLMQIWRMHPDGGAPEKITSDDRNNWFAHPSPDGKAIVFLSYDKDVKGHPANKDVQLRLMSLADKRVTVLANLFGGQGTINVPSWSPDSLRVAFVSYQINP